MQVKDLLDKLRKLDEADQADFERREAISKLKKLTSGNEYNDANHTYIDPKTGAIIYSRDGSPMPAKSFNDPRYDTASVGLELRQLLKKVGLPVTADARGNAMVDPAAFANLGNDPAPKPPTPFVPNPVGLDGTEGDRPAPRPNPRPDPKPPGPVGPQVQPTVTPTVNKIKADPKDQDRFRELIDKFKTYKKPSEPKPEPKPPGPDTPPEPGVEKKWPTTPDEIKAFQKDKDDPRQPGQKLVVDGLIGTHTYQALINAGYKPPAGFKVTAYKPTGKPIQAVNTDESLSEDDQILAMIKGINVK